MVCEDQEPLIIQGLPLVGPLNGGFGGSRDLTHEGGGLASRGKDIGVSHIQDRSWGNDVHTHTHTECVYTHAHVRTCVSPIMVVQGIGIGLGINAELHVHVYKQFCSFLYQPYIPQEFFIYL